MMGSEVCMMMFTLACELAGKRSFGGTGVWAGLPSAVQWHAHFSRLQRGPVPRALLARPDLRTVHPLQDTWRILITQTQPHAALPATHTNTNSIVTNETPELFLGLKEIANLKNRKQKIYILFCFPKNRNDINKWWQNYHSRPNYCFCSPFNLISTSWSNDWDFKAMSSVVSFLWLFRLNQTHTGC